eukprot:6187277-Pleurochrysis_carterae.AAC.4
MERIARSATPLSLCTCGGQVVLLMPLPAEKLRELVREELPGVVGVQGADGAARLTTVLV